MAIDPTAIVDSGAEIEAGVTLGPYCVIGAKVKIGGGTVVGAHAVIQGPTTIGRHNRIAPHAAIGLPPQDLKYRGEETELIIGDHNDIREFVTFSRGTEDGGMKTVIGNRNLIMAYVHIAHDCIVGNHTIFANAASLAGHVTVEDHANLGGFSLVHQFCRVGRYAFSGMRSNFQKDLPPYMFAAGEPVRTYGPNKIGLERAGFPPEKIEILRQAWRDLVRPPTGYRENREKYAELAKEHVEIAHLLEFIGNSSRGITN